MFLETGILLVTAIFLWILLDNYFPKRNYPPGPFRIPILGNGIPLLISHFSRRPPFVLFDEMSKKFGSLCYLRLGVSREVVITDDFETSKQILHHDIWVDRPFNSRIAERSFGKPLGIIFPSGDPWKEMRRFSMRTLRDFGYGKQTSMQLAMDEEVKSLVAKVDKCVQDAKVHKKDALLPMKHLFTMPVLNILWSMVSNIRTAEDDEKLKKLIVLVDNLAKANPIGGNLQTIFPFLRYIAPELTGYNFAKKCHRELQQYFRDILEKRRKEGSYMEDKRDFIDMFVQEIDRHEKLGSNPNHYTDEQFITTIIDLFEAGSETSSNTLEFAFYFIMKNPQVQEKIQEEIDRVVGHNRYPTMADKSEMPYTEATLHEVQRMANVLPMVVRCPTEDCNLNGYFVPKGVFGVLNIYSIHMKAEFWGDPLQFRPERFLDAEGKIIPEKVARVIPFGAGKRVCLGEQMARTTLFTYFACLLQNYTFLDTESRNHPNSTNQNFLNFVDVGFTLSPKPYLTKVIKRN